MQRLAYKDGPPGSRRAPCLGCGGRVISARDPHCLIGGTRDGSLLVVMDVEPQRSWATDIDRIYTDADLHLLGVAHRACVATARRRLEAQEVELPAELPQLLVDQEIGDLPQLHLPPPPAVCAFCGAAGTTSEHVFPKWVSRTLTTRAPLHMNTDYGPRRLSTIDITAPVCAECNTRWLSVLENDVQPTLAPLIRGAERALSVDEQRLVATWAVKTALMLDLASGQPVIPTGFYHQFRQLRTPLPSHAVWLGAYLGTTKAVWAAHHPLHIGIGEDETPNGFASTFTVFRCLFQVVGHFTKGGATVTDTRLLAHGLWPIWPRRADAVAWPREHLAFGDDTLADLAASISG